MAVVIHDPIPAEAEEVGHLVIGCGIAVHRALGPGYRESIYRRALCLELEDRGITLKNGMKRVVLRIRNVLDGLVTSCLCAFE